MPRLRCLLPALLVAAAVVLCPAAAWAGGNQETVFQDDGQLKANPAGTLATLRSLGVTRVRVTVNWAEIAPSPHSAGMPRRFNPADPGAYPAGGWAPYDAIVRTAAGYGIGLDFLLTGPAPQWAEGRGEPAGGPFGVWEPSGRQFGAFVSAVGKRYSGSYRPRGAAVLPRVNFWSIWNEPDYGQDLAPQATGNDTVALGAALYRGLLAAAWGALAGTGHTTRHDTILIGELAPRGFIHPIGNFGSTKPLRFLLALYCVDGGFRPLRGGAAAAIGCPTTGSGSARFRAQNAALFAASAFADHPYASQSSPQAPNVPTSNTPGVSADHQYSDLPELGYLEAELDRLNGVYGSRTRYAIWNTEYGYRTRPPDPHAGVSPATAAYYDNWGEYLSWRSGRVASFDQFLLVDPPTGLFASGLEFPNGARKPGFDAFRMPLYLPFTTERRGTRLEVWGAARPAHFARGTQRVEIQFQAGSRGPWRTLQTVTLHGSRGYFDTRVGFPGAGGARLSWAYPGGQRIYSRTQAIAVR